jgi:predicted dehydrogenase
MPTPTAVALLGCTHPHSRAHLITLRVSPEVERVWLWDPDRAAAEALAAEGGGKVAGVTDDLSAALREEVEFALVCRSNEANPETVVAAVRAGKHVFSEKPMALNAAALRPVLAEVRDAGVSLGVCYPWRCHPAAEELRGCLDRGLLGRLMAVEARMVTSQVRFRDPNHWLFTRARGGGGILHWLGCHFLDLLRFVLRDEPRQVSALTGTLGGCDVEVEDSAAVAMRWASGALGTFAAGYQLPRSRAGYSGASYDTYLAARGVTGNFTWQPTRAEEVVRVCSVAPEWETAPEREFHYRLENSDAYGGSYGLALLHRFFASARAGTPPIASGEDALRVLEWVEAVYASAERGTTVTLGE